MEQYQRITESLSEIKERTASVETKIDIVLKNEEKLDGVKEVAHKSRDSASSAHKRIDKIDKWMFAIGSTLLTAILLAVMGLVIVS